MRTYLSPVVLLAYLTAPCVAKEHSADIVVYGATASGVIAAVAAAREERSVLLIEPGKHVGGMVTGGLGATDVGNIAFLVSDPSKALDQAREAAIADARRKAEVYARAAGIRLGQVEWITEQSGFGPVPLRGQGASAARAAAVPIATGEDTFEVTVTVGFTIAQ